MEVVLTHLQDNAIVYFFVAVALVPLFVFFHRYLVPVVQWALEIAIYMVGVHVATHYVTRLAAWFRRESSSEYLAGRVDINWTTPLVRFWDREAYIPEGILYFEIAALVAITILVLKMRPMRVQKSQSAAHERSARRSAARKARARR